MQLINLVASARKEDGNAWTHFEACFKIDTTSCAPFSMCHVSDQESRASDFGNDLVVDFDYTLFSIDAHRLKSSILDGRVNALFIGLFHLATKPHSYKCLCANGIRCEFLYPGVPFNRHSSVIDYTISTRNDIC